MVCINSLSLNYLSLRAFLDALNIKYSNLEITGPLGDRLLTNRVVTSGCFTLPGLPHYLPLLTPLIIKATFVILLALVLYIFYRLIPDR